MHAKQLIIRPKSLASQLGVSKTTLWRWRREGILPQPLKLGPRMIGWEKSTIDNWLENQRSNLTKETHIHDSDPTHY